MPQILSFHVFYSQQGLLVILKPSFIIYLSNVFSCEATSENITATISDHLTQFLLASNVLSNPLCNKSNTLERDWSKFKKESFNHDLDYFDEISLKFSNYIRKMLTYHINSVLDIHAPFKKVNKHKLKFKIKPWIMPTLQKSISVKNSSLKKFINCNDSQTKNTCILDIKTIEIFYLPL